MPGIRRALLPNVLIVLACSAGLLFAAENHQPTPEEFKEQVRQYNESGRFSGNSRQRQVTAPLPKGAEEFQRAISLHSRKGATPGELKEAASLYQAASDAGIPQASTNLALMYLEGKGVKKDVKKAISLLNMASKKNIPQADIMLARLYLMGKDVKMDEKKGEMHLNRAARTGNEIAVKMLAEYKEWKKKNELAMKQYQDLLKKAKMNMDKPQAIPGMPSALPPAAYPFPVIPGLSYLGGNRTGEMPANPFPSPTSVDKRQTARLPHPAAVYPFPVIPGLSYLGGNPPAMPVKIPYSRPPLGKPDAKVFKPASPLPAAGAVVETGKLKAPVETEGNPAGKAKP